MLLNQNESLPDLENRTDILHGKVHVYNLIADVKPIYYF